MYEELLHRMETQHTNIAARRITGVARSARLEILRMVADVTSIKNLFIQQCGISIDRALRCSHSTVKTAIETWLRSLFGVDGWAARFAELDASEQLIPRRGSRAGEEFRSTKIEERWLVSLLNTKPHFVGGQKYHTPSIFYTEAEPIIDQPTLKTQVYTFENTDASR